MANQGLVTYPGIGQIVDANMSFVHGITPSRCSIRLAPQHKAKIKPTGDLKWTFGREAVTFRDCKVDLGTIQYTASGEVWAVHILDRRWRWTCGEISGRYNIRDRYGRLLEEREKTPQELATLCLEAMGEVNFSVGDLPQAPRPEIDWDYTVPAAALADLCDLYGCRVVLQLDGKVAIRKAGDGKELPGKPVMEAGGEFPQSQKPDAWAIVCGPTRYQWDFPLEAVGQDVDGEWRPINSLSYKPAAGWYTSNLTYGLTVAANGRIQTELAKATVHKCFRVRTPLTLYSAVGIDQRIADYESFLQQIILEDSQVEQYTLMGEVRDKPAQVYGKFLTNDDAKVANQATGTLRPLQEVKAGNQAAADQVAALNPSLYKKGFSLDPSTGIITFPEVMLRNSLDTADPAKTTYAAPTLYLRTAFRWRDAFDGSLERYIKSSNQAVEAKKTKHVHHNEIVLTKVPQFGPAWQFGGWTTNQVLVDAECRYYLDNLDDPRGESQNSRYPGLLEVELDGAISQITFTLSGEGISTAVYRNDEDLRRVMPFGERRRMERDRDAAAVKQKIGELWDRLWNRVKGG